MLKVSATVIIVSGNSSTCELNKTYNLLSLVYVWHWCMIQTICPCGGKLKQIWSTAILKWKSQEHLDGFTIFMGK